MIVYKCWATNVYYGEDGSPYECTSFMSGKSLDDLDLHRLIVRVKDRAYQIVKAMDEQTFERLYFAPNLISDLSISNNWSFKRMTLMLVDPCSAANLAIYG